MAKSNNQLLRKASKQRTVSRGAKHDDDLPAVGKFVIRLPDDLRKQIKELAELNHRSMNSEIVMVLQKHVQHQTLDQDVNSLSPKENSHDEKEVNDRLDDLKRALLQMLS